MPSPAQRRRRGRWLSAHLYFDAPGIYGVEADAVIRDVVAPIVDRYRRAAASLTHYFFVRYADPGPHIRLRLFGSERALERHARPILLDVAHASASVARIEWTPYVPELERYGGAEALPVVERAFRASTDLALSLLGIGPDDRALRFGRAMLAMLVVTEAFFDSRRELAAFARRYAASYLRAVAPTDQVRRAYAASFDQAFERQASRLTVQVRAGAGHDAGRGPIDEALGRFGAESNATAAALGELAASHRIVLRGAATDDWYACRHTIVPSLVHMTHNRLGVSRLEEAYLAHVIARALAPAPAPPPSTLDTPRHVVA